MGGQRQSVGVQVLVALRYVPEGVRLVEACEESEGTRGVGGDSAKRLDLKRRGSEWRMERIAWKGGRACVGGGGHVGGGEGMWGVRSAHVG
jgi:hypothetical protein